MNDKAGAIAPAFRLRGEPLGQDASLPPLVLDLAALFREVHEED